MKILFFKLVNRVSTKFKMWKIANWSYFKWLNAWLDKDPDNGFFMFANDYIIGGLFSNEKH